MSNPSQIFKIEAIKAAIWLIQSVENRRKECHRFWLPLRHAVILISNDRTSASKKINGMALIRTLTVSTTAFKRTKEKFYAFRQTVLNVLLF